MGKSLAWRASVAREPPAEFVVPPSGRRDVVVSDAVLVEQDGVRLGSGLRLRFEINLGDETDVHVVGGGHARRRRPRGSVTVGHGNRRRPARPGSGARFGPPAAPVRRRPRPAVRVAPVVRQRFPGARTR